MGDLAKRPRGGWQFGNRPRDKKTARPRDEQGRPLLPNGKVDDAPQDCFTVKRIGSGKFQIRHFRDPDDTKPCCAMEVTRSPRDVEIARVEGIDVDIVTLRRAPECVKGKQKKERKSA
jgi:hypothetical protein